VSLKLRLTNKQQQGVTEARRGQDMETDVLTHPHTGNKSILVVFVKIIDLITTARKGLCEPPPALGPESK